MHTYALRLNVCLVFTKYAYDVSFACLVPNDFRWIYATRREKHLWNEHIVESSVKLAFKSQKIMLSHILREVWICLVVFNMTLELVLIYSNTALWLSKYNRMILISLLVIFLDTASMFCQYADAADHAYHQRNGLDRKTLNIVAFSATRSKQPEVFQLRLWQK